MRKRTGLLLSAALLWGLFIFFNSLLPGGISTQMSDAVVEQMPEWTSGIPFRTLVIFVRKSGHFLEYALLGLLCSSVFASMGAFKLKNAGNLLFPCLLWALLDEWLQTFVAGRSGMVIDVLLDLLGIIAGCLLAALFHSLRTRRKKAADNKNPLRE